MTMGVRAKRAAAICSCLGVLAGCGGDDTEGGGAPDLGDCTASVALSGGVEAELSHDDSWACGIPFGGDTGVWMVFLPIDAPIVEFSVSVDEVHEGETGTFPASVSLRLADDRIWATPQDACSVVVEEHSFVADHKDGEIETKEYLFTGNGSCASQAATVDGTDEAVAIGDFTFRFPSHWF